MISSRSSQHYCLASGAYIVHHTRDDDIADEEYAVSSKLSVKHDGTYTKITVPILHKIHDTIHVS